MAHVAVHRDDIELDAPTLVEGLPGVGLVGKLAADHLVDAFDMVHYGTARCEGLPEIAVYSEGEPAVRGPVRIHAAPDEGLLVLQSDAPVSPDAAESFAGCITDWFQRNDVTPLFLSGMPSERNDAPSMYGVATGEGADVLADADVPSPTESGAITGPTGALVHQAQRVDLTSVGLVVEADPQFPDPEAAAVLLAEGIAPIADVGVDTETLAEQAEEIRQTKAQLAQQMQGGGEASTSARPLGFQ